MVLQAFQVALAMAARGAPDRAAVTLFSGLMWAVSVIAYVPMVVMLGAVAAVSFRYDAFSRWLAWFSAAASLAHFVMTFGLVAERGPFVPGASLTYALYAITLVWLIATTTVMVFGSDGTPRAGSAG
jgi:hypothetical protein